MNSSLYMVLSINDVLMFRPLMSFTSPPYVKFVRRILSTHRAPGVRAKAAEGQSLRGPIRSSVHNFKGSSPSIEFLLSEGPKGSNGMVVSQARSEAQPMVVVGSLDPELGDNGILDRMDDR